MKCPKWLQRATKLTHPNFGAVSRFGSGARQGVPAVQEGVCQGAGWGQVLDAGPVQGEAAKRPNGVPVKAAQLYDCSQGAEAGVNPRSGGE